MKKRINLTVLLTAVLVLSLVVPTFAWYTVSGYPAVEIDFSATPREASSFSLNYGVREIEAEQTALNGLTPKTDFGTVAPSAVTGFAADDEWIKSNAGVPSAITNILNASNGEATEISDRVVLSGQLGSTSTSGGIGGAGGGENVEPEDSSEAGDNKVTAGNSSPLVSDTESGDGDNRLSILGNFSEKEDKMVGVEVKVVPKDVGNVYDVLAAEAVRFALFYEVRFINDVETNPEEYPKTIFYNSDFSYYDAGNGVWQKAVAQNRYFEIKKSHVVHMTAVVWLDGFADPRAESGSYDVRINVNDYGNIATQGVSNSASSSGITSSIQNNANLNVENVFIPEAYYNANGKRCEITGINSNAFNGNASVVSVVIPDTVRKIGANAFANCPNLKSVTVGNGVTEIGYNFIKNCPNLEKVFFRNPYGWQCNKQNLYVNLLNDEEIIAKLIETNVGSNQGSNAWYRIA